MLYARVEKTRAEEVKRALEKEGVFDGRGEVIHEDDYILFPVKEKVEVEGVEYVEREGSKRESKPKSLKEALSSVLNEDELEALPSSFNIVGDIAILELPDELMSKRKVIGEALLKTFKGIKVAAVKKAPVGTTYRVPEIEVVAGEERTETVHKEFGCRYKLDVSEAYFSPRLGTERMRVAEQVKDGERVLVMFAGVGPYAVLIAKKGVEVVAVELNPKAVEYMRENVEKNHVEVEVLEGDVRDVVPKLGKFDRIVMPLPKDAGDFLDVAFPALNEGGVVHFYGFAQSPEKAAEELVRIVEGMGYEAGVLDAVACGSYNPAITRTCVYFRLK